MPLLPDRPLLIDESIMKARWKRLLLLSVFIFGVALWFTADAALQLARIRGERRLWATGVQGAHVVVRGDQSAFSKGGVEWTYDYDLAVTWTDAAGATHDARVAFDTFWWPVKEEEVVLRADPADPSKVVLSWQLPFLRRAGARFVELAVAALLWFMGLVIWLRETGHMAALRLVAEDGEELRAELLQVKEYKGTWTVRARVEASAAGPAVEWKEVGQVPPLLLDEAGGKAGLALRSPRAPGRPVLVADGLRPFVIPGEVPR